MVKPDKINIMGVEYSVYYFDKPSDVDIYKRESLWGQCDYWTRTIRIYDNGRPIEDVLATVVHEMFHAIGDALRLKSFNNSQNHDELDLLALALVDTMFRNNWWINDAANVTAPSAGREKG